jgi:hypothetical protein
MNSSDESENQTTGAADGTSNQRAEEQLLQDERHPASHLLNREADAGDYDDLDAACCSLGRSRGSASDMYHSPHEQFCGHPRTQARVRSSSTWPLGSLK